MNTIQKLVALAVANFAVATAHASIVVFEYSPELVGGTGYVSEPNGDQIASGFTLDNPYRITDIHWWGVYSLNALPTDSFIINFYDQTATNFGPVPGGNPLELSIVNFSRDTVVGATDVNGNQIYRYSADFASPFDLAAGTQYWLSIINGVQPDEWGWLSTTDASIAQSALFRGGQWLGEGAAFAGVPTDAAAFQLTGVPVPATALLLGSGLVIGGLLRRRNKTAQQ